MEANEFITKLKADGSETDVRVFDGAIVEYESISRKLSNDDKKSFALNVLCLLCRNLNKSPKWSQKVNTKSLLTFSIKCLRDARGLHCAQRIKTLACIFHLHKHITKQFQGVSSEAVLSLSYLPFEDASEMPKEYCKTYWAILADRLIFIEKLKTNKCNIRKLQQKMVDHICVVIEMYNTVTFCSEVLPIFMKKMFLLFSERDNPNLNTLFEIIFQNLLKKKDYEQKTISETASMDLYKKFMECFSVIFEDALRNNLKNVAFLAAVKFTLSILKNSEEICHCIKTFYLNSFCDILNNPESEFVAAILKRLYDDCEMTERLNHEIMNLTYPYLSHIFRIYIDFICMSNNVNHIIFMDIRNQSIDLMYFFMSKLVKTEQLVKCEGCRLKSGAHDSIRLSFLVKCFIAMSLERNCDLTAVSLKIYDIFENQQCLLFELKRCFNHEKCLTKSQTDIHNSAILLYKSCHYELSNKLFDIFLKTEVQCCRRNGYKNKKGLSRGFYNRAICESDMASYKNALKSAFLAVVFSETLDGKNVNLAIDIKSKALNVDQNSNTELEILQTTTLLDVCRMCHKGEYGDLGPYFSTLEFSELLKHEFSQYVKMWPSVMPIAGVWNSLMDLLYRVDTGWITGEQEGHLLWTICEVIMETVCVVRNIHNAGYSSVINKLIEGFEAKIPKPVKFKLVYVILLFLGSEYDIEEASRNYGWRDSSDSKDPDTMSLTRAIPQEHEAIGKAVQAVELMTEMLPQIKDAKLQGEWLLHALQIMQLSCMQLLHFDKVAYGLQLCHILCVISKSANNTSCYQNSLGLILYHAMSETEETNKYLKEVTVLLENVEKDKESTLIFICRFARYLLRCKNVASAGKFVHYVQLNALKMKCDESMDLVIGHLLEVQSEFFKQDPGRYLSQISTTYKHYLSLKNTGTSWASRRLYSLTIFYLSGGAVLQCIRTCRHLQLWRRARSAAPAAVAKGAAPLLARVHAALTSTHRADSAQVKIDNHLKHILGLQPSNEQQAIMTKSNSIGNMTKDQQSIKTELLESVMDVAFFKRTAQSPTSPCANVSPLKMPEFLYHRNCSCYACENPVCNLVFLQVCGLEASIHFRNKEFAIARNYFDNTLNIFDTVEKRLLDIIETYNKKGFEKFIVEIVRASILKEMYRVQIEIMVEAAFFELSQENYIKVDEIIFDIKEKMNNADDSNLYNEYLNLLATSAHLRREVKRKMTAEELVLGKEMANLKLSPKPNNIEATAVTPESKITKLPETNSIQHNYKEEDIPILKKRLKKLNLEETSPEKTTDLKKTRSFKIPVPKVTKAIPEIITPQSTRSKPTVCVSKMLKTPKIKHNSVSNNISTPSIKQGESIYETPSSELFCTPMTSLKTYQNKKSLKNQVVKNLEMDFQTPTSEAKCDRNLIKLKDRKTLKRATSPGKLEREKKEEKGAVNTRRLRTQVNFSPEIEVRKTRSKQ